jgi:hypothetical protein
MNLYANPFRPSAGHMPPYLAGRAVERETFKKLLRQTVITDNGIITGLRGIGKTVLLQSFMPEAKQAGWLWTGDDFTEISGLSEETIIERVITDLSLKLSQIFVQTQLDLPLGFTALSCTKSRPLQYGDLRKVFDESPGLSSDKLKSVLRHVEKLISDTNIRGIVFAYDEAQNLTDKAQDKQYPLSLLLDVFQSIQKSPHNVPFLLVLTGLPTLFAKLNEARTYTERMFEVLALDRLSDEDSREAIVRPIAEESCPVSFSDDTIKQIIQMSGGYPYFIQFICKEVFDVWIQKIGSGQSAIVPKQDIIRKLDQRFFSARWDKASDRQRDFMKVIAMRPTAEDEFTVQDIVRTSEDILEKPFKIASAGMMLKTLTELGFVFRNRRGKYSFAVPLLNDFIVRQMGLAANLPIPFGSNAS